MGVSVKVYLNHATEEPEIRRFSLNEEVSSNFETLLAKIADIFPSVQGKKFQVYWKDADEELIVISSDEELVQALDCTRDGVFNIYLQIDGAPTKNDAQDDNIDDVGFYRPPITDGFGLGFEQLGGRRGGLGGPGFHSFAGRRGGFAVRGMSRGINRGHPYRGHRRGCGPMSYGGCGMGAFGSLGFGDQRMVCGGSVGHDVLGASFFAAHPLGPNGRGVGFGGPQRGFGNPRMGFIPPPLMPRMVGLQF